MAARVQAVAKIADREHHGRVKLDEAPYLAASRNAVVRCFGTQPQTNLEGFLFPDTYDFLTKTTSKQLVAGPDQDVLPQLAHGRSGLRALEEPHAVRRAEDRLDGREGGRGPRRPGEDRRGHLQPAPQPDAARDRRDPPLRPAHPADPVDHEGRPGEHEPVQHRQGLRDAADPDREPGPRRRSWRPPTRRTSTTSTTCASPAPGGTSSSRAATRSTRTSPRTATGRTRDDPGRAARPPGLALALAADAERRLRGGRARLELHGVRHRGSGGRGAGSRGPRLRRRERDDPAQGGRRRRLRRGRRRRGEHAALPGRARHRDQHRRRDPGRGRTRRAPA